MKRISRNLSVKLNLFIPILLGIIISVTVITFFSIQKSQQNIYHSIERDLSLEVKTIIKMFEREYTLKLENVKTHLKIAHNIFYSEKLSISNKKIPMNITNQISQNNHKVLLNKWFLNNTIVQNDKSFVDNTFEIFGGTTTIFQRSDSGFVRISTNVRKADNSRAVGTYIPNESPVVKTILNNETFFGRAFVVNDWYITAYEPILNNGEIIGMLYVGGKEKDLDVLRNILSDLKIGKSGYSYVLDVEGTLVMHPLLEGENLFHRNFIKEIIKNKTGIIHYDFPDKGNERISAYDYFDKFELYVAASITKEEETSELISEIVINSILIGVLIIIAFSIFAYFITTKNIHKILSQVEHSRKQLSTTKVALKQSEKYFQALFNNSGDETYVSDFSDNFIEVNQVACDTLKYTKAEFLKMKFRDIKTKKYKDITYKNLESVKNLGKYTYESEHVTKDGKVIPVEMKSRIIDYKNGKAILTIARDITERKEIEERILITGIETEQKERKRFAADLHDDLAPILSTIKLYSDLLKKGSSVDNPKSKDYIKNINELVDLSISSTKEISNNIRPNVLQDFGLAEAINDYCSYINETKSIKIKVNIENYNISKRGIEETILYQATKELINNTLKYANASNIKIELKNFEDHIIFYYKDDGIGFDTKKIMSGNKRLGLNNIFYKVKTLNGNCDLNSTNGNGMFLLISLKLDIR